MSEELKPADTLTQTVKDGPAMPFFVHANVARRSKYMALAVNLFSFKGRFSRESYWLVYAGCVMAALASPLFTPIVFWPLLIALTWVSIAAVVKRFHDRGKHGAWWLVSFIPFLGTLWILIECGMLAGDANANQYGATGLAPVDLLR